MTKTDEIDASSAPLMEHLIELRTRIMWCLLAFTVAMVFSFLFWNPIFDFLTRPLCRSLAAGGQGSCGLVLIALQEGFMVAVQISMMGGLVLAFPVISYQLWRFVAPGLYKSERGAFLPFLIASPGMFFAGAAFAYYVITPMAFTFFLGFQQPGSLLNGPDAGTGIAGIAFQGSAAAYLQLTIKFIVAFGLCFQLPVLLTLMGKAGLVSSRGLAKTRKYAIVGILVVAGVVTPPDVMSQVILFAVIYPLYEISIFLVRRAEKQTEARMRSEGTWVDIPEDDEDTKA